MAATIALCIRDATNMHHRLLESESLRFIVDYGPVCDEITCPDSMDFPPNKVPASTLAARCINGACPYFLRIMMQSILFPIDKRSASSLNSTFATASAVSTNSENRCCTSSMRLGHPLAPLVPLAALWAVDADNLYALAWALFPHVAATSSIGSMQVLLLHICNRPSHQSRLALISSGQVLYNIHWSKWGIASALCGIAVRVDQAVRLHHALPHDFGLEHGQPKLGKRLWPVALILDAHLSMSQGRTLGCQQAQWDLELLANLHVSVLHWPLSEILWWHGSLVLIQQRLNMSFSSIATNGERFLHLQELDAKMIGWKEELPAEFQPEQQAILDSNAYI
ncbi:hypothetical protein BJY01DRAFT_246112 [Aspergillus pseudoustus]|uniref:Transcription factor domain-containing protein n=1 Tax=Aspergillus pseudoustus TaxID=1810923 RepID=A0ABR4K9C1_9EURO